MKKVLIGTALAWLVVSAQAFAAPVQSPGRSTTLCPSKPTACPTGAYTLYTTVPGFQCSINNIVFKNFVVFLTGGATGLNITPDTTFHAEGFNLAPIPANYVAGQNGDYNVSFTATTCDGSATLTDVHATCACAQAGGGNSDVIEQYCPGAASVGNCPVGSLGTLSLSPSVLTLTAVFTTSVSQVGITKNIAMSGGTPTGGGTASDTLVTNTFSNNITPVELTRFELE